MLALLAFLKMVLQTTPVWACAVCGVAANDQANNAFLKGTALLSLMPLGVIGGAVFYIYRRHKAANGDASTVVKFHKNP